MFFGFLCAEATNVQTSLTGTNPLQDKVAKRWLIFSTTTVRTGRVTLATCLPGESSDPHAHADALPVFECGRLNLLNPGYS